VLQCVAVCCSVLQRVAVCCSALQCAALRCSVLQCVAVLYAYISATPPLDVTCQSRNAFLSLPRDIVHFEHRVAVSCSVLQCVAVCCSVLHIHIYIYIYTYIPATSLLAETLQSQDALPS